MKMQWMAVALLLALSAAPLLAQAPAQTLRRSTGYPIQPQYRSEPAPLTASPPLTFAQREFNMKRLPHAPMIMPNSSYQPSMVPYDYYLGSYYSAPTRSYTNYVNRYGAVPPYSYYGGWSYLP
jgi:hypothetical protein